MINTNTMQVLALKEIHEGTVDHNMFILFDTTEQQYYIFGTRRILDSSSASKKTFDNYAYIYSDVKKMTSFIEFLTDNFKSRFVLELYKMDTIPDEYIDNVDFDYIRSQIYRENLLAAYDNISLTRKYIASVLGFLC
jgi:hypothetical protein